MRNTITLSYTNNLQSICDYQISKPSNESLRIHCASVRFNKDELDILNKKRGDKSKGKWLRLTSLDKLPVIAPEINIK